jgi:hypothetical protein
LFEQTVDEGGFAVVDVGDDRDVADRAGGGHGENRACRGEEKGAERTRAALRLRPQRGFSVESGKVKPAQPTLGIFRSRS